MLKALRINLQLKRILASYLQISKLRNSTALYTKKVCKLYNVFGLAFCQWQRTSFDEYRRTNSLKSEISVTQIVAE